MKTIQLLNIPVEEFMKEMEAVLSKMLLDKLPKTKVDEEKFLYTREETSKLLKVSYTTLWKWNDDGTLPAQKLGKRVYYNKESVIARLNA
ncbi:MAG: helix-turn-helix domain-containing protein [Kaistella sp.]